MRLIESDEYTTLEWKTVCDEVAKLELNLAAMGRGPRVSIW